MVAGKLDISGYDKLPAGMLGLGVFDGFHLGHQSLANHCDSLLSIYPHPRHVIFNEQKEYLMLKNERNWFFNRTFILNFNTFVASLKPEEFLTKLCHYLQPSGFVIGYDFHFGAQRLGTPDFLKAWCKKNNLDCIVVPKVTLKDLDVKSGFIRKLISQGSFNQAIDYLGHHYCLTGKVIHGDKRGSRLGFPTANLDIDSDKCLFLPGVYLAKWHDHGIDRPAIVYMGTKPTFKGSQKSVEVHVPNFSGNLYGQILKISVYKQIRNEQNFESKEALIAQINKDISQL